MSLLWTELVALAAATLAGVTGFGGAALLLPVLVIAYGARAAIPVLTVAQLVGNGSRVWFNRRELDLAVVGWFALGGVPLAVAGGFVFAEAPLPLLERLIGLFLLLMVLWRHMRLRGPRRFSRGWFAAIAAGSSFLSALLGSVGPLMAPFFLAYGLTRGAYIGTEALSTVVMHATKLVAYGGAAVLGQREIVRGLVLAPAMVLGSYFGKHILDRVPERVFVWLVEGVMLVVGARFLIGG
ncbi:MAG TPA: sulfite exporter TauE/SafE family protein [Longimicrobiaceae bacterium]|nr:sulfite exporter TauE/SafE family protein [Longimicrobiaceae bacterium]